MAHSPSHRGPAPEDERQFAAGQLPAMRSAAADLCWLLDRGYALRSALELTGNRYSLTARQRTAVSRSVCSREDAGQRQRRSVGPGQLAGQPLWIDGYNVLTIVESALGGGVVLLCRDGCCRDIAGIHRRYRQVNETIPALELVGRAAKELGASGCCWWLDKPISNSGRLKKLILETASANGWNMEVELTFSPDHVLAQTDNIIATSDGIVLDRCRRWLNFSHWIIEQHVPQARLVDLFEAG
ncbi:MAG TPA: DUF434 domain-containing protein [Verrucomicrobiae bacterium]|nr:DUF434 domain-containing protein [Verrucomicrobiae bacterium]